MTHPEFPMSGKTTTSVYLLNTMKKQALDYFVLCLSELKLYIITYFKL